MTPTPIKVIHDSPTSAETSSRHPFIVLQCIGSDAMGGLPYSGTVCLRKVCLEQLQSLPPVTSSRTAHCCSHGTPTETVTPRTTSLKPQVYTWTHGLEHLRRFVVAVTDNENQPLTIKLMSANICCQDNDGPRYAALTGSRPLMPVFPPQTP